MPVNTYAAFPETYQLGLSAEYIRQVTGYYDREVHPDETGTIYTYDYREFPFHPKRIEEEKPTAQFAVKVNGQEKVRSDASCDLDAPTVVCDANINDEIEIVDLSNPYGNYVLNKWDFQYRIVPVDDTLDPNSDIDDYRGQFLIKSVSNEAPHLTTSSSGPNKYFKDYIWKEACQLYPDRDFYIELYMQVYDRNTSDGSVAGGENGTYACVRAIDDTPPSQFPKGNTWYFTTVLLRVNTQDKPLDFSISSDFPNVLEVSDGDTLNIPVTVKYKGPLPTADHDPAFMNTNLGACYADNAWSPMVYTTNVGPLNAEEQTINATIPITVTGLSAYPNGRDLLISVNYPDAAKNPNTMSNRNPEELKPGVVINDGKIRLTEMDAPERNQIPAKKDACTLRNKHLT